MGRSSTIINRPVQGRLQLSKTPSGYTIHPSLTAFAPRIQPMPKDIIFVLDISASMDQQNRWTYVKIAVGNLLKNKLTPIDTFSIVIFNTGPSRVVTNASATSENIKQAMQRLNNDIKGPAGDSHFRHAFELVRLEVEERDGFSSIIFLTDGEDNSGADNRRGITAQQLIDIFPRKNRPRIIPMGVQLQQGRAGRDFLNTLSQLGSGGHDAICIDSHDLQAYHNGFDKAFVRATDQSQSPAQLGVTAQTGSTFYDETDISLEPIMYDGKTSVGIPRSFDSTQSLHTVAVRFDCDNASLRATHRLTEEQKNSLQQNQSVDISIPAFQYKDTSTLSWALALGQVVVGSALLTGLVIYGLPVSLPLFHLNTWMSIVIKAITTLLGAYLALQGTVSVARKTLFLPTKLAHDPDAKEEERSVPQNTSRSVECLNWLSSKEIIRYGVAAVVGAGAGYMISSAVTTAALQTHIFLLSGMSPPLFFATCSVGGAALLLLLVCCCCGGAPFAPRARRPTFPVIEWGPSARPNAR